MLTQKEMVQKIAKELGVKQVTVEPILNKFFELSFDELQETGTTSLSKLGNLVVRTTKERTCTTPAGDTVTVAPYKTVKFRPSKFTKKF